MNKATGKLPVWDIVDASFHFTRHHFRPMLIAVGAIVLGMEGLDYAMSEAERGLGLSDPTVPVPWLTWLPLHFCYLVLVTLLLSIASVPIVEMALGRRIHTSPYFRIEGRALRMWGALFVAWVLTFFATGAFQFGTDWLLNRALQADFELVLELLGSPWYAPGFWAVHLLIMVMVLARLSFFVPAVGVVETRAVFRRSWELCRGRFWRVLLIGLAVEAPFVLAYALLPLPFHGVLGFGAESVFQDGVLVTAPDLNPVVTLLKHVLDGTLGLAETGTFTAAAVFAYRHLRPELEFD